MMQNLQWQDLQMVIRKSLLEKQDLVFDPPIIEDHKGAFLALIDPADEIICEVEHLQDGLSDVTETVKILCQEVVKKNLPKEEIEQCSINLCVVREAIYLKNPLEWDMDVDGVCFQWGNRFKGFYMPYEIARIGGDKIRILDRLCCHKCKIISSAWRLPEGLIFKILTSWYR